MAWLWLLLIPASGFLYAVFFGAPFVPAFKRDIDELLELAEVGMGTKFVDLGSGDGKVLLAAAQRGATVTGYEINPVLWLVSLWRLRRFRNSSVVRLGSLWPARISGADVVFLYLHTNWMERMSRKLRRDGHSGQRVISYVFELPNLKLLRKTRNAFIYQL